MKLANGITKMKLENGEFLYFWYANNKGHGTDNVTIVRSSSPERAAFSKNQKSVIAKTTTSHWMGNVNFSSRVQSNLGL